MKIKNFDAIAVSKERKTALEILNAGLEAIDTKIAIQKSVQRFGNRLALAGREVIVRPDTRIFLVSVGKCGLEAAQEINSIMGDILFKGIVIDVQEGSVKNDKIKVFTGDHPFPSERNILATKSMMDMLSQMNESDIVITIISGGGSSLLCQPDSLSFTEEKQVVDALFRAGAPIDKVNTVRKHLSLAKGGYLAKQAYPAQVVSLIFSDVPGYDVGFVASGPTVLDTTTISDAMDVIKEFCIEKECPFIEKGLIETPKDKKFFENVTNNIIVSNSVALEAMQSKAESMGFSAKIKTNKFSGHARHVGAGIISALKYEDANTFLLYGGESTVIVKGGGNGGRNQEIALSSLRFAEDNDMVIALASDGIDNSEVAGGICDIISKEHAEKLGLDVWTYLNENNSFEFFQKTGDYIKTGITGSNVSDIVLGIRFQK